VRILRRLGEVLPGLTWKQPKNRQNRPGQHGAQPRRKVSEYKLRLEEKQKVRFNYGLTERQLRRYFRTAARSPGNTGLRLMQLLESRLDNVLYRVGIAPTIRAARQLVNHGHVMVDGKRCSVASRVLSSGEVVTLKERAQKLPIVVNSLAEPGRQVPPFLTYDGDKMAVTFVQDPAREDVQIDVKETMIVEWYSRIA
jgi:small subunit ribosomal protein S4